MPLAPKLNKFSTQGPLNVNFDFQDLTSGVSYIEYQGYDTIDDTTQSFNIDRNVEWSQNNESSTGQIATGDTTFTKRGDTDFDLNAFEIEQTIVGRAYVSISFGLFDVVPNTPAADMYCIVKIRKWDGSTETDLGSAQTQTISDTNGIPGITGRAALAIDLSRTFFAKGDVLRVTVELWGKFISGANPVDMFVAHSPNDKDGTRITVANSDTTQLKINIPYEIQA